MHRILCFALLAFFLPPLSAADETLWDIYQLAKKNDPDYLRATAGKEANKEEIEIASAAFWPSLNLNASHNRTETGSVTNHQNNYGASLDMAVFDYSMYVASDRADTLYSQSDVDLKNAELTLMVKVASRYFDVLSARDNVEFSKAEQQAIARQLDQTKQRFDVGLVAITDVHEAQARHDLAFAQGIKAENELGNALEALREVTGQVHHALYKISEDAPMVRPKPDDIEEWTKMALKNNPDLHSKEQAVELAQYDLKASGASNYPSVYANITYSDNDAELHGDTGFSDGGAYPVTDLNDPPNQIGNVILPATGSSDTSTASTSGSITLSYNFYDGGTTRAKKRRAQAYLTQAKENLEKTRRAIQRQSRNAYLNVVTGASRIKALKQAVISRESAQKAAEAGFEVGTKTTVDVLDSRRELFSAQNEYAKSRYDFVLDSLRLRQAAGTLNESHLQKINQYLVALPTETSKKK